MSNEQTAISIPSEINNLIEPAKNGNSSEAEQATFDVSWLNQSEYSRNESETDSISWNVSCDLWQLEGNMFT